MTCYKKIHCVQIKLSYLMDNFRKMDVIPSCHSGTLNSSAENVVCRLQLISIFKSSETPEKEV